MASGDTLYAWTALDGQPPSANYGTLNTRNSHPVIGFLQSVDSSIDFTGVLPAHYAGGGLTLKHIWMAATATSGTCRWKSQVERLDIAATDLDADSFAAVQSAGGSAQGTSGALSTTTVTFTSGAQMDSLAASEAFRLRVTRDGTGATGTDNLADTAQLLCCHLLET